MQPYSVDFRQKVVDAYKTGEISQRKLAKTFGVSLSFIQKLLKQARDGETIAPKVRATQTPTKLNAEQLQVLRQLVEEQPDATLAELRERLKEKTGVLIAVATVDRMVRLKLELTFKKRTASESGREHQG